MNSFAILRELEAVRLSFYAIVKNEQHSLPRCLDSVVPYVDDLVIVDTGSQDDTVAIAQHYGATIHHFTWCDDFAAARNFALRHVTGNWVLTLDADEELIVRDANWKALLLEDPKPLVYWLTRVEMSQPITPLQAPRLFQNSPNFSYIGRYHEQLVYQHQTIPSHLIQITDSLYIQHYGYGDQRLLEKNLQRDIPMLERVRAQEPLSLLLLMTLADAYLRTGQEEKARSCWAEAFERIAPDLLAGTLPQEAQRLPALLYTLASDLLYQEDYETALLICRRGVVWFPNHPSLLHLTGMLLREMGLALGAIAYFEQCLTLGETGNYYRDEPVDHNFMTLWAAYELGLTYGTLGQAAQAIAAFERALSFDPSYEPAREELARWRQA